MEEWLRFLQDRLHGDEPLGTIVDLFEEMCRFPAEDDLLFEAGTYPYAQGDARFYFSLVRQLPAADGEYLQLHLDVIFPPSKRTGGLREIKWASDFGDDRAAFFRHVRASEAFLSAREERYDKTELYLDET